MAPLCRCKELFGPSFMRHALEPTWSCTPPSAQPFVRSPAAREATSHHGPLQGHALRPEPGAFFIESPPGAHPCIHGLCMPICASVLHELKDGRGLHLWHLHLRPHLRPAQPIAARAGLCLCIMGGGMGGSGFLKHFSPAEPRSVARSAFRARQCQLSHSPAATAAFHTQGQPSRSPWQTSAWPQFEARAVKASRDPHTLVTSHSRSSDQRTNHLINSANGQHYIYHITNRNRSPEEEAKKPPFLSPRA